MYAAWQGSLDMIRLLLDAGADKSLRDSNEEAAVDYLDDNGVLPPEEREEARRLLTLP